MKLKTRNKNYEHITISLPRIKSIRVVIEEMLAMPNSATQHARELEIFKEKHTESYKTAHVDEHYQWLLSQLEQALSFRFLTKDLYNKGKQKLIEERRWFYTEAGRR